MAVAQAHSSSIETDTPSPRRLHSRVLMIICGALLAAHLCFVASCLWRGQCLVSSGGSTGYDFACFWGAGKLALQGKAIAAYDWTRLKEVLDQAMSFSAVPLRDPTPFFYPPVFFLVLAPLALLPFTAALAVWFAATLAAYLAAIRAILPGATAMLAALGAPMVVMTLWIGQNGLLTAALIGGALALLERRPLLAGVLIGLLIYKPHFGLLFPLVLAASGRWRAFASAAATVAVLTAITGMIFGWDIFAVSIDALLSADRRNLASGAMPWFAVQSLYGTLRLAGFGSGVAWGGHGLAAVLISVATVWIWRGRSSYALKAAAFATAALVVTPYMAIYDMPALAVPMAFLVRDGLERGFPLWEARALKLTLAMSFLLTYAYPVFHQPAAPIVCAGFVVIIGLRLLLEGTTPRRRLASPGPAL